MFGHGGGAGAPALGGLSFVGGCVAAAARNEGGRTWRGRTAGVEAGEGGWAWVLGVGELP